MDKEVDFPFKDVVFEITAIRQRLGHLERKLDKIEDSVELIKKDIL